MISKTLADVSKKYFAASLERAIPEETPRMHVDEIAARVAKFYERVRSIVDYKDEHLLRKSFVNRVFRRRLMLGSGEGVSEAIIKETIRAGHLPNDTVPETKIAEINTIIRNYRLLAQNLPPMRNGSHDQLIAWLTEIAANAIEESLFPPTKDLALADLMFRTLRKSILVRGTTIEADVLDTQVFIAVQRALLGADRDLLHYRIFTHLAPGWQTMPESESLELARRLQDIKRTIDRLERNRFSSQFFRLANRYNTAFYLIGDIFDVSHSPESFTGLVENESEFESEIHRAYAVRFKRARARLNRLALLSVISFLISKIAVAIAIEVPLETYLTGDFSARNTLINVILPPLLMFLIVMFIRLPGKKNFALVMHEVKNIVTEEQEPRYVLEIPKKRNAFTEFIVQFMYAVTIVAVFYYLIRELLAFGFNGANITVFIFFVSMVAATGVKIHNRAKDLSLEKKRVSFLSFLLDLVSMPFVAIGRWILAGLAKFNPIVLAINLIIEAPFQVFVSFLENFRGFIKAKKEEIT
jgi:hypothetical protein